MTAVAQMEHTGVPIDTNVLDRLRNQWEEIRSSLIGAIDADYGVYQGSTFKMAKFEEWLIRNRVPWPRLPSGTLARRRQKPLPPQPIPLQNRPQSAIECEIHIWPVGLAPRLD